MLNKVLKQNLLLGRFQQSGGQRLRALTGTVLIALTTAMLLSACPTSINDDTGVKKIASHSGARGSKAARVRQGWVPDLVGLMSFASITDISAALELFFQAMDGKDRPLLGLQDKWKQDFGFDVTQASLLSMAGVNTHEKVFLLWRDANAHSESPADIEHLLSIPVTRGTHFLGMLTQLLAESQQVRRVDSDDIVHFAGPEGTTLLVSVPHSERLLFWLHPKDANGAAALMAQELRRFSEINSGERANISFVDGFLEEEFLDDSANLARSADKAVSKKREPLGRFHFKASKARSMPWISMLSLENVQSIRGDWRVQGNQFGIRVKHHFRDGDEDWQKRFVSQRLPISHCAFEKEALLTLHLPSEAASNWAPGASKALLADRERLEGMLSLYLYGRENLQVDASVLDLSRFVLIAKPKNKSAAEALWSSMKSGGATLERNHERHKSIRLAAPQPGRELELVSDETLFGVGFGEEGLLAQGLIDDDNPCSHRSPGLVFNGSQARSQRWHEVRSPLGRILGQLANGLDFAQVSSSVTENILEVDLVFQGAR